MWLSVEILSNIAELTFILLLKIPYDFIFMKVAIYFNQFTVIMLIQLLLIFKRALLFL